MVEELRRQGFAFAWQLVDTEAAYVAALDTPPDVILCDYSMPGLGAPRALELLQARRLDLPFIVVTGNVSEEVATDCIKRGASDYLLKDRLTRLGPAVAQAIAQARLRRERAQTLQELQESEDRFRRLVENAVDIIYRFEFEPSPHFSFVSPAIETMIGYSPEELYADPGLVIAAVHPDDRAAMEGLRASDAASPEAVTTRWTARDGGVRWAEHRRTLVRDETGRAIAAEGIIRDITFRKRAEDDLRESKAILEGILDAMPVRVFWKDKNLVYLGCNAIFARDAGFADPKDLIGKDDYQMGWRDQADAYRADDREVIESGHAKLLKEEPQTTPEGNTITLLTSKLPLRGTDGEITGILGTYMEITERKRAEAALLESENELRAMFNLASIGIAQADPITGRMLRANEKMCAITGYSAEELLRLRVSDITFPDDRERDWDRFQRVVRGEAADYQIEKRYVRKDGSLVWVNVNMTVIRGEDGRPIGTVATIEDITERRHANEALRQSEALFRSYFESPLVGIGMSSTDKRWIQVNDRLCSMLGFPRDELLKMTWTEMTHPEDLDANVRSFDRLLSGEIDQYELEKRFVRKDGTIIWTRLSAGCVRNADGDVDHLVVLVEDISERKAAEEALRASEQRYRQLFTSAMDGIAVADAETGILTDCNDALEAMVGRSREDLIGQPQAILHPPQPLRDGLTADFVAIAERLGQIVENKVVTRAGLERDVEIRANLMDLDGRPQMMGIFRDITDRKRVAEALRESEARFRLLAETSPVGIFETNEHGATTYVNKSWTQIAGLPADQALGSGWLRAVHPEDRSRLRASWESAKSEPRESVEDYRFLRPDGTVAWVAGQAVAMLDPEGRLTGYVGTITDITPRKRDAEALRKSEARYRGLFEQSPIGIYRTTPDGKILDANPALLSMLGYDTLDELRQRKLEDSGFQPDYPRRQFKEMVERAGSVRGLEARWTRKDGGVLVVRENALAIRDVEGKVLFYEGAVEDVTERTVTESARRRLAAAVDQAAEAVVVTDPEGTIEYVNPAFERITGYTRDEAIGRNPRLLKSGRHDAHFYRDLWATITGGRPWTGHFVNRRKDGSLYEEEATISPVRDDRGVICNFVAVKRDVTNEIAMQQQLVHAQKLETAGQLAAGIAHDFNNLLQALLSQLAVVELRLRGTAGAQKPIEEMSQLVQRGATLTRQLLLFARRGTTSREPLDLNRVVEGAATLVRRVVREDVALITELSGEPLPVFADHGQLDQVLMNLAVNASDAMPDGGRLTLRTSGDDSWVRVSVTDVGQGIAEEALSHLFEPFFSTKAVGKGTGLGLSVVHGIVTSHGGTVEVASQLGVGATFTIVLPRHAPEELRTAETGADTGEIPAGRGERLLLVEDEDGARQGLLEVLGTLGYVVTAAASGEEAGVLPSEPRYDLLLTDFLLPGISGTDLAVGLRARWPGLKVVMMSGYAEDDMLQRLGARSSVTFLQKPFGVAALALALRRVLDDEPPPRHG
jgi:two-component system cell cycle sensor histidine kinase/response regulator CckA